MMANPFDQFDEAGANPFDRFDAPAAKPVPNTALMSANAANRALAGIPDALLNTPNRLLNLGRAAIGSVATLAGRPDLAPEVTEDPDLTRKAFERMGFIKPELDPTTTGQRLLAGAIQGGVGSLVNPAAGLRQAATNALVGGASGLASSGVREATGNDTLAMTAGMLTPALAARGISAAQQRVAANQLRQQQNAVRDQTVADARAAGYVLSPSEVNPSMLNRAIEGVAGKLSTRQLASARNQEVTNALVRRDLGVANDVPLTPELMAQIRREAYQTGYAPVAAAPVMRPGAAYRRELDDIAAQYRGAARSFPDAVNDEVTAMIESLRVRQFAPSDAIQMTQVLRDQASRSFANGNTGLGRAQRSAATAIENQIERGLFGMGQQGGEMLGAFRNARRQMARTHTIEAALNPATGNVQAMKLAAELRKGKPLSDGIETAARSAAAFKNNFQSMENVGAIPGISPLDVGYGAGLGTLGAIGLGPSGALLAMYPAMRPLARGAALSPGFQNRFANPDYNNSLRTQAMAAGDLQNPGLLALLLAGQQQNQ